MGGPEEKDSYFITLYRRAYDRVKMDELAVLITDGRQETVGLRNISPKGIGIEANCPLREQERYKISFRSALFRDSVVKEARLAWCKESQNKIWQAGLELGPTDIMEFK